MRIAVSMALVMSGCLMQFTVGAETPKIQTTRQLLEQFGKDVSQAWVDFPKDNQKTVRDTKISDLNSAFSRDLPKTEVPQNYTVLRALEDCIEDIAKTNLLLKFDKMQQDRTTYVNACLAVFRRGMPMTADYKTSRTTQQCFELVLEMFTLAREKLHTYGTDIQQQTFTGISLAVNDLIRNATIPEKPDPTTQMDLNIKEARKRFPMTTPEMEQANRSVVQLLESTAKAIQQLKK